MKASRLTRWELLQDITRGFWQRWRDEYLNTLINRPKWNRERPNFSVGDLVIIKEDQLPPSHWKLGRVISVSFGVDNLVRSATIKTSTGVVRRPIVELALLEKEPESNDEIEDQSSIHSDNEPIASGSNENPGFNATEMVWGFQFI